MSRLLSWIHDNQRFAAAFAILLAALLILVAVAAYCFSTRYKFYPSKFLIFDHWTGKCQLPKF